MYFQILQISDVAFVALNKSLRLLKSCYINGSLEFWTQFKSSIQNTKVKSFLLPPKVVESSFSVHPLKSWKVNENACHFLYRKLIQFNFIYRFFKKYFPIYLTKMFIIAD